MGNNVVTRKEPYSYGQKKLRLKFSDRTRSDVKKLDEFISGMSCGTFYDIARYGDGRPPNLRSQAIQLFLWKLCRQRVNLRCQIHGFLPHIEIFVRAYSLLIHRSPITDHSSFVRHLSRNVYRNTLACIHLTAIKS